MQCVYVSCLVAKIKMTFVHQCKNVLRVVFESFFFFFVRVRLGRWTSVEHRFSTSSVFRGHLPEELNFGSCAKNRQAGGKELVTS